MILALALPLLGTVSIAVLLQPTAKAGADLSASQNHTASIRASGSHLSVFVQPGAHAAPILSVIRDARKTLRLEVYLLTNRTVIQELGRAKSRGVDVRVLLEERPFGNTRSARLGYSELKGEGVPVKWANEGAFRFTHEKAMEVDSKTAGIFTLNLTSSGIFRNREFGVIDRSSRDAATLKTIFAADWSHQRPAMKYNALVVSPNNSRSRLDKLIDASRHTLDLYAEEVQDSGIEDHLVSAERRGVHVRLLTSSSSPGTQFLQNSGVEIGILQTPYIHAKAIVADGTGLFIGSENLSTTSLDQNREVGILVNNLNAAAVVERTFRSDWRNRKGGSPPPTATSTGSFDLRVRAEPNSVTRGERLTITANTIPGAGCSIRVTYPDGYVSRAKALAGIQTVGPSGVISWSWSVGSTVLGVSKAAVTCAIGSKSRTATTTFLIT